MTPIWNWRSGGTRVPLINIDSRKEVSADGTRWAIGANRKRSLADKRYDVVRVWTLKRRVNGKVVVTGTTGDRAVVDAWLS